MMKRLLICLAAGTIAGAAFAKLPPAAPQTDAQKAEKAAKDKASADKEADLLGKSQDRAVAHSKKSKGVADTKPAPPAKKKQ